MIHFIDDDITLPQKVCDICVSILQNFLFFCNHIERFQNNLFGASRISNKLEKSLSPAGENSANLVMESEFVMSKNELVDQMTPGDIETEDESLLVPIDRPVCIKFI